MTEPDPVVANGRTAAALIALHEAAAEWFMRRDEPGWTGRDEQALQAWLQADPLRREIFDGMALTNHDLHQLPLVGDGAWRVPAPPEVAAPPSPRARATRPEPSTFPRTRGAGRRRAWGAALTACALLLLGGGYGWHRWDSTATYARDETTVRGEIRQIDLPDGTSVALNFDTTVRIRFFPRRREVVLDQGEAFFKVAADGSRPFTVASGSSQLTVLGTAFNVRAASPQLIVKVLEGRVAVRPDRHARDGPVLVMAAGAGLSIDPVTGERRNLAAAPDTVGDWRTGQIHLRRMPLGEVAQELARYLGQPVALASPDLAQEPISGVVATARPQDFLQALPAFLPLQVRQLPDGSWQIARR